MPLKMPEDEQALEKAETRFGGPTPGERDRAAMMNENIVVTDRPGMSDLKKRAQDIASGRSVR